MTDFRVKLIDELQRAIDALDAEKVQNSPADVVSDTTEVGLGLEMETVEVEQIPKKNPAWQAGRAR